MINKNLTLVTALFDIGRGDLDPTFSRSYDHYLNSFKKLLTIDLPMTIFCDKNTEKFVFKHRKSTNTKIINKTLDDLRQFPFYENIQTIRKNEKWKNRSGWISQSPQSSLELYNPLVMNKQFFLNDASIFNFFDTKYFLWIDAGIANTVNVTEYFTKKFVDNLLREMDKMCYVAFPYDGTVEVHGFEKTALDKLAGTKTNYVVRGGIFGGTRSVIETINAKYYTLLSETLTNGLMGTEESIFTIIAHQNPNLINLHMIESDGLVYKFFDYIRSTENSVKFQTDGSTAIYALTYNLPSQFKLWVESFKAAYPTEFANLKKYVINNSTRSEVADEYATIFKENGFTEFKFNNIGINDARYEAAKHFNDSLHEYMIFFEDDMLLHSSENIKSKLGFNTHYPNIFDISAEIIKYENLDYLKLSFDEFYGNNLDNWGWYNLPADRRETLFPNGDKRTRVAHIGSLQGVPYAVGEYHYCNWPILFTKHGNQKVFLETEYAHKYEQTWMSMVCSMQRDGVVRAGTLLASIINHERTYHYPREERKENKNY